MMVRRKTKIICTLGPAVKDVEILKQLLINGMNLARFNFSHGTHQYHGELMEMVREASRQTSIPVAILLDTKGPEIRTGPTKNDLPITLERGKEIILTTEEVPGDSKILSISHKTLPKEISPGKHIFIADGVVDLEVTGICGNEIHCQIQSGAVIGSHKNVNVTGIKSSLPAITDRDIKDIMFGIENHIDFIAASFIRKPDDVKQIRSIIDISDAKIDIIAKIEDQEGLDNLDEIIRVSNGIMVARGDLGVQIDASEIPLVQKRTIKKCNLANKPVITATQMLDSMIHNPLPTRAETNDVANAIFDGTDAVMLSGETANGKYPVKAVAMMHKIALEIENSPEYKEKIHSLSAPQAKLNMAESIAHSGFMASRDMQASILTPTLRGNTPRLISKYRPANCIIAVTPHGSVLRNLLLYWGVYPLLSKMVENSDLMIEDSIHKALKAGLLKPFDKVVIMAGIPINSPIMLNTIRLHMIGKVIGKSARGYGKTASGRIVKVANLEEAQARIKGDGTEILLTRFIDESFKPVLAKTAGYILESFSSISWEEIVVVNPELVGLATTPDAMKNLKDGQLVTIDGKEKIIFEGLKP
ncbi:MAG: pyruvate kinase [Spirochaetales bacterium]|nr:pyruvate kinase [Spirochaetales bacterium]